MAARTMRRNDFNLAGDPVSGATAMLAIVAAAQRRDHLADGIKTLAWQKADEESAARVLCIMEDRGQAVHLANALGLDTADDGNQHVLPRQGKISGVAVIIDASTA